MYVRNKTTLEAALSRGALTDDLSVCALAISLHYALRGARLERLDAAPAVAPTDPPDMTRHTVVRGCSVTAAGTVFGPASGPFARPVTFRIGNEVRRLAVFGERRWKAGMLGELAATEPLPFEAIALSFENAFGGSFVLPPGLMPGTDLPHPGGKVPYSLNDRGIGFYQDKESATGAKLPFIELADRLVTRWTDRPEPGGLTPCPELPALRLCRLELSPPPARLGEMPTAEARLAGTVQAMLLAAHHAPGYLVLDSVPVGTAIELQGVGKETLRFELPAPPARVTARTGGDRTPLAPVARSIHVDADRRTVSCLYGYELAYTERTAPSWIVIEQGD